MSQGAIVSCCLPRRPLDRLVRHRFGRRARLNGSVLRYSERLPRCGSSVEPLYAYTRTQYCRSDGATREITNSLVILLDVSAVHDQDVALRIVRAILHYKEHSNTYVPEEKRQGVAHVSRSTIGAILFVQPKVHVRSRAQ